MTGKNTFLETSYEKLKTAINNIDEQIKNDIYALSFWFYTEDDDPRYPIISVGYNTNSNFKDKIASASNEKEAKWNFAFWLQDEIEKIGGADDKQLKKWFATTPHFYSEKQNEMAEEDDELFDEILEQGSAFCDEFSEEIILLTQRLFADKIIEIKFGKNIPVLVHELEYYDKPVSWTVRSNPKGLVDEFVNWTKFE